MEIKHTSVSRKKCYDSCPAQYKFRYHLKVPAPESDKFYLTYGTIIHRIAELFVQNKAQIPIESITNDIVSGKIELEHGTFCPEIPAEYKKKIPKHIKSIHKLTQRTGTDGYTEYEFNYDLDPPNQLNVVGFIDRLIIKNNKAYIIDYKTTQKSKYRVNSKTVVNDLQLKVYARIVQQEFKLPAENIKAALFFLDGEELVACQYSQQSLIDVEKDMLDSYISIRQADPDKVWGKVSWQCKNCDYANICPFYKSSSNWDGDMSHLESSW
jgi:CRISPR/Cas system-associated exonuclease Cas4 (RecB family)